MINVEWSITFTARALSDLLSVRRWLRQPGSGLRARLRLAKINRALVELRFAPYRWPEGDAPAIRERPVEGHRIFYQLNETSRMVTILRVFGPFQDRTDL